MKQKFLLALILSFVFSVIIAKIVLSQCVPFTCCSEGDRNNWKIGLYGEDCKCYPNCGNITKAPTYWSFTYQGRNYCDEVNECNCFGFPDNTGGYYSGGYFKVAWCCCQCAWYNDQVCGSCNNCDNCNNCQGCDKILCENCKLCAECKKEFLCGNFKPRPKECSEFINQGNCTKFEGFCKWCIDQNRCVNAKDNCLTTTTTTTVKPPDSCEQIPNCRSCTSSNLKCGWCQSNNIASCMSVSDKRECKQYEGTWISESAKCPGESSCTCHNLGLQSIEIIPSPPAPNQQFQIKCTYTNGGKPGDRCMRAYIRAPQRSTYFSCTYDLDTWKSPYKEIIFNCDGLPAGTYTASCDIEPGKEVGCCCSEISIEEGYIVGDVGCSNRDCTPCNNVESGKRIDVYPSGERCINIENAINNVPSGGTVILHSLGQENTYVISSPISITKPITIKNYENDKVVISGKNIRSIFEINANVKNPNDIVLKGLTMTGATHGIILEYSSKANITGNTITKNQGSGIVLIDSSQATITGNTITKNQGSGIVLIDSSQATITGNTITENQRYGIELYGSSQATITGNTFKNCNKIVIPDKNNPQNYITNYNQGNFDDNNFCPTSNCQCYCLDSGNNLFGCDTTDEKCVPDNSQPPACQSGTQGSPSPPGGGEQQSIIRGIGEAISQAVQSVLDFFSRIF